MNVHTLRVVTSSPSTSISFLPVCFAESSLPESLPDEPQPANVVPTIAAHNNAANTFFFIL